MSLLIRPHWRAVSMFAVAVSLPVLVAGTAAPANAAPARDILSGTWRVSRTCLTVCVSPPPVLKVVHHLDGDVYATNSQPPQMLLRMGMQVLVHGPKDSLLLNIRNPGRLMSGSGVGADGSTFTTTWRCVAPRAATTVPGATGALFSAARPARPVGTYIVC